MQIVVTKLPYPQCQRCRRATGDVGLQKYWPDDLCRRCCEVLASGGWLPDRDLVLRNYPPTPEDE